MLRLYCFFSCVCLPEKSHSWRNPAEDLLCALTSSRYSAYISNFKGERMVARFSVAFLVLAMGATSSLAQGSSSFTSLKLPSPTVTSRPGMANERHLQPNSVGALYGNSAFAHGYRHGYDEGFHVGDFALQMGRNVDQVSPPREYRHAPRGYRSDFGNRESFDQGYQAGFLSGYSDAITGEEYRLNRRASAAAAGLSPEILPPNRRAHFDEGVAGGYASAQSANAPKHGMTVEYIEQYCRKTASGMYALEYCSGFSRGYLLGIHNDASASTVASTSSSVASH